MKRFSKILVFFVCILLLVVVFIDQDSLNSLMIRYDDLVVKEVAVLSVDNNKVIYTNNNAGDTSSNSSNDTSSSNNVSLVSNVSENRWVFPVEGDYVITTYFSSSHNALDIYSYKGYGSSIFAANSGTVVTVMGGCNPGYLSCNGRGGNYVVIRHNIGNYYTVYMHLKTIGVKVGDAVSSGQIIGTMGNTGNVIPVPTSSNPYGGTHLHFCLYVGEPY